MFYPLSNKTDFWHSEFVGKIIPLILTSSATLINMHLLCYAQSMDCPAQSNDRYFVQQTMDCLLYSSMLMERPIDDTIQHSHMHMHD